MYLSYFISDDGDVSSMIFDRSIEDINVEPYGHNNPLDQIDNFGYSMCYENNIIEGIKYNKKLLLDVNFAHNNPTIIGLIREYKLGLLCN